MNDVDLLKQFERTNSKIDEKLDKLPCRDHEGRLSGLEQSRSNDKDFAKEKRTLLVNKQGVGMWIWIFVITVLAAIGTWAAVWK